LSPTIKILRMSKLISSIILALALIGSAHAQQGHKAHVHGAGKLDISIEQDQFVIALALPLEALVGFERAPLVAKEAAALEDAAKLLKDAAKLFLPTAAARCVVQSVTVEVPFSAAARNAVRPAGDSAPGHADVDATYAFRCARPAALKGLETQLFTHFKRLYYLDVQRIGPQGQGAGRLTPQQPVLAW